MENKVLGIGCFLVALYLVFAGVYICPVEGAGAVVKAILILGAVGWVWVGIVAWKDE